MKRIIIPLLVLVLLVPAVFYVYHTPEEKSPNGAHLADEYEKCTVTPARSFSAPQTQVKQSENFKYSLLENELLAGNNNEVILEITNERDHSITARVELSLIYPVIVPDAEITPLATASKTITVPANTTVSVEFTLSLPAYTSFGEHILEIYENETLAVMFPVNVVPVFNITIEKSCEVMLGKPFTYSVTIMNGKFPINNIIVDLNLFNNFNAEETRAKIPELKPNEKITVSFNLTPVIGGRRPIEITVYSPFGGDIISDSVKVLYPAELGIFYKGPESVGRNEPFNLSITVLNAGDVKAENVSLSIITPENVTVSSSSMDLGDIQPNSNKTVVVNIRHSMTEDFVIIVNATSSGSNAIRPIFINVK
ncbi:MAG: hypothetical protein GXO63_02135 [Candidatus Micrarchaeota archaeon]|nr:hypothetical protein [Candidatus Micrarchaeota archaeon]